MGLYVLGRVCRSAVGFFTSRSLGCCRTSKLGMMSTTAPLLMVPPIIGEGGKTVLNFQSLVGKKETVTMKINWEKEKEKEKLMQGDKRDEVYFAGSSHGWLFAHNRVKHDVFMLNPINGRQLKLPSLNAEGGVSRVALSDDMGRVMIIFGGRLAFCVPGHSTEWTLIGSDGTDYADAVYSSTHDRFFCIPTNYLLELQDYSFGSYSELEVWDISKPLGPGPRIERRVGYNGDVPCPCPGGDKYRWMHIFDWDFKMACWRIKYVLVHGDDLYVVVRHVNPRMRQDGSCSQAIYISMYRGWDLSHPYKTFHFEVFKIDWRGSGRPLYMEASLQGLAMFLGTNQSFALPASDHPDLKPDSIYFTDDHRFLRKTKAAFADTGFGGHDNGIFNYQNYTFSSCDCGTATCPLNPVYYEDIRRIQPPPLWFNPPLKTED